MWLEIYSREGMSNTILGSACYSWVLSSSWYNYCFSQPSNKTGGNLLFLHTVMSAMKLLVSSLAIFHFIPVYQRFSLWGNWKVYSFLQIKEWNRRKGRKKCHKLESTVKNVVFFHLVFQIFLVKIIQVCILSPYPPYTSKTFLQVIKYSL